MIAASTNRRVCLGFITDSNYLDCGGTLTKTRWPLRKDRIAVRMNIRETRNAADPEWLSLRAEFIPELSLSENQNSGTGGQQGQPLRIGGQS